MGARAGKRRHQYVDGVSFVLDCYVYENCLSRIKIACTWGVWEFSEARARLSTGRATQTCAHYFTNYKRLMMDALIGSGRFEYAKNASINSQMWCVLFGPLSISYACTFTEN